jgi:hypothetical protein
MIWTQLWFEHQKKRWEERMQVARSASKLGHHAYAAKQQYFTLPHTSISESMESDGFHWIPLDSNGIVIDRIFS